jgi:polyol permease family
VKTVTSFLSPVAADRAKPTGRSTVPGAVLSRSGEDDEEVAEEATPRWAARLGMQPSLRWGYVGLLLFMVGDGVESGFLSPYLINDEHFQAQPVAFVFTLYGIVAGVAAWSSGALSDLWGPRRVMMLGLAVWAFFEVIFLAVAIPSHNYTLILLAYGIRGIGYPLFAYGFLVWIAVATSRKRLGSAVGWFWFAFTGGFPTLGSLIASFTVPKMGAYASFWLSLGLVVVGGLIALLFVREQAGRSRLAPPEQRPVATLLASVTLMVQNPKIGVGMIVRTINTAPQLGFLVFLPIYFTTELGFSLAAWLQILTIMFTSNIIFNLIFGVVGDKVGWRNTVVWFGGVGSAVTTLLLYYLPTAMHANFLLASVVAVLYGATLAGYVPLSALMPTLAPGSKGAAMSALNFGAGMSAFVGPLIVAIFLAPLGVVGVMWIFAVLYVISAVLAFTLKLPRPQDAPQPVSVGGSEQQVGPADTGVTR